MQCHAHWMTGIAGAKCNLLKVVMVVVVSCLKCIHSISCSHAPPVFLAPSVRGTHGKEYMRTDS